MANEPSGDAPAPAAEPTKVLLRDAQGQEWFVYDNEVNKYLRSDKGFTLAPGQTVNVARGGEVKALPSEQAQQAIASFDADAVTQGFATEKRQAEHYASPLQGARAFVAAAARKATFGGSDWALTKLDEKAREAGLIDADTRPIGEEMQQLQQRRPGATMAGDVAGMVAPLLAGGGAGAGSLVRGVARGAEGVGSVASRLAMVAGAAEGGLAARAVGAAARGGVEFAAFEAGDELSRQALANEALSGEKLAAAMGHGALVGLAFGGGGSLAWSGAKRAGELGASALAGARRAAGQQAERLGATEAIEELGRNRLLASTRAEGEALARFQAAAPEAQERTYKKLLDEVPEFAQGKALRTTADNAKAAEHMLARDAERVAQLEARAAEAGEAPQLARVVEQFRAAKAADPGLREVEGVLGQVEKAGTSAEALAQIKTTLAKPGASELATKLRGELMTAIDVEVSRATKAAEATLGPEWAGSLQSARAELEAARLAHDLLAEGALAAGKGGPLTRGGLETLAHLLSAGPVAAGGALLATAAQRLARTYGNETFARLALGRESVGSIVTGVDRQVREAVGEFFQRAPGIQQAAQRGGSAVVGGGREVARVGGRAGGREWALDTAREAPTRPALGRVAPATVAAQLARNQPPQAARMTDQQRLDALVAQVDERHQLASERYQLAARANPVLAPLLAQAQATSDRVHAYLQSQRPRAAAVASLTPRLERVAPSGGEVARFERLVRIAESPSVILSFVRDGSITRTDADALRAMYPELFTQIRSEVQTHLDALAEPLPYRQALDLSDLLGVVGHSSLRPGFRVRQYAMFAASAPQPLPPPGAGGAAPGRPTRPVETASLYDLDRKEKA